MPISNSQTTEEVTCLGKSAAMITCRGRWSSSGLQLPVHVVEQPPPARVDVEGLVPARQEVTVRLGEGVEVEAGHQGGVRDRLEVHVPGGRPPLQLDHDEAPGRVQPEHVQPVAGRNTDRCRPTGRTPR